ncbi:MAG: DUF5677 domain-containing protein [Solidesulfovibrio sp.]
MITVNFKSLAQDNHMLLLKANSILLSIQYDERDEKQYYPLLFAHSIHGMAKSCNILIENSYIKYVNIFIRSMIESLAKLSMLSQDIGKLNLLKIRSDKNVLGFLDRLKGHDNDPGYEGQLQNLIQIVSEHKDNSEECISKNESLAHIVSTYLKDEYIVLYKNFCFDAHSDLFTLQTRHTTGMTDDHIIIMIPVMLQIVVESMDYLLKLFPVVTLSQFEELRHDLENISNKHFS